jgi:hypothetical protein
MLRWSLIVVLVLAGGAARAAEAKFNFRKKNFDPGWFRSSGPNANECIEPADDGLRIFYPDHNAREPVGVYWKCRLRGDFVATARYDIRRADATPNGSGIELFLMLDNPSKDGIPVLLANRSDEGRVFNCMVRYDDENGNRQSRGYQAGPVTAESDRGRLRVERKGTDFFASIAEGDAAEFKTVLRIENIDRADVKMLRFAGLSRGAAKAQLDVRLLEFELRGGIVGLPGIAEDTDLPAVAPGAIAAPAPVQAPARNWAVWLIIAMSGVVLLLILIIVALVALTRLKSAAPATRAAAKKKMVKG